jgi:hypothetical protein
MTPKDHAGKQGVMMPESSSTPTNPAVAFLKRAAGLEDLCTAYEAAMKRTKIFGAQQAMLGLFIAMASDNPKVPKKT